MRANRACHAARAGDATSYMREQAIGCRRASLPAGGDCCEPARVEASELPRTNAQHPSPVWWWGWELPSWGVVVASCLLLVWVHAHIPWQLSMLMVLPCISIVLVRAFIEHRLRPAPGARTASVGSDRIFGLLFARNNLHIVHRLHPQMPWFETPGLWRRRGAAPLAHNGHHAFRGHWQIACRWLLTPVFVPAHPAR